MELQLDEDINEEDDEKYPVFAHHKQLKVSKSVSKQPAFDYYITLKKTMV
eukprot:403373228